MPTTCEPFWVVAWALPLEPFWASPLAGAVVLSLAVRSVAQPVPRLPPVGAAKTGPSLAVPLAVQRAQQSDSPLADAMALY
ncbi:MAG: hypothetical protein RIR09_1718 [Pseudomonadota bacterium]